MNSHSASSSKNLWTTSEFGFNSNRDILKHMAGGQIESLAVLLRRARWSETHQNLQHGHESYGPWKRNTSQCLWNCERQSRFIFDYSQREYHCPSLVGFAPQSISVHMINYVKSSDLIFPCSMYRHLYK